MIDHVRRFVCDEDGLTSVEYALLLSLITGITIGAWTALGGSVTGRIDGVNTAMQPPAASSSGTAPTSHPWWWGYFHHRW